MATVTGSTSQHSSKYDFYIVYTTNFDTVTMKWTVGVTVYLRVMKYAYSGNTSHSLSIGGSTVASKSNYHKTCSSNSGTTVFKIASGSKTYAASASARTVKIVAKLTAPSGGYGPGTCSVSKSISLPASLSSAGAIGVSSVTSHSCVIKATGLSTSLGYTRTVKFYYKLTTATSWVYLGSVSVGKTSSSASKTANGLLPGKAYNFKYVVLDPSGDSMKTATVNVTTLKDSFTLALVSKTSNVVKLSVNGLDAKVNTARSLKGYYRKKGESNWTTVSGVITIASTASPGNPVFTFSGLSAGTDYEFSVHCFYGNSDLGSASYATATAVPIPDTEFDANIVNVTDTEITLSLKDNKIPLFNGHLAVYIRGENTTYYHIGIIPVVFTATTLTIKVPVLDMVEIKTILQEAFVLKLFFINIMTNAVHELLHISREIAV